MVIAIWVQKLVGGGEFCVPDVFGEAVGVELDAVLRTVVSEGESAGPDIRVVLGDAVAPDPDGLPPGLAVVGLVPGLVR